MLARTTRFLVATALAASAPVLFGACLGSSDSGTAGRSTRERVDSTQRFEGRQRQVAAALERFEAAVLDDDVQAVCGDSLRVREDHANDNDNGGARFCTTDPVNTPSALIERAGGEGEYDVVVREIDLVRWKDRIAKAVAELRIGESRETAVLRPGPDGWRIVARWTTHSLAAAPYSCNRRVKVHEPLPSRPATLRAALGGPFAGTVRPNSLVLAAVTYRPDYTHIYAVIDEDSTVQRLLPVGVWAPGSFDASSTYLCRNDESVAIIG